MDPESRIIERHHVTWAGDGPGTILFSHGYGCDQAMWRYVVPELTANSRGVLFDHVGSGRSKLSAYSRAKYGSLQGYADDVVELCHALHLKNVVFVGHSVSAMIGALASIKAPELFRALVMVGPSPCYVNDGEYVGGFEPADIEGMLEILDSNYLGWSTTMAPVIMGHADRPELADELALSFCRNDPVIARHFARVTFTSDNRADLPRVTTPTLILQCTDDAIAPEAVGRFVHDQIKGSTFVQLEATGHCPNLSAPVETASAIKTFLSALP